VAQSHPQALLLIDRCLLNRADQRRWAGRPDPPLAMVRRSDPALCPDEAKLVSTYCASYRRDDGKTEYGPRYKAELCAEARAYRAACEERVRAQQEQPDTRTS